jgi:pimeloyl-ACP methyl ester carboxylesterase
MAEDYTDLMAEAAKAAGLEVPQVRAPADRQVELNGIDFHYLDWGNEELPPVVLLHGGALTAHTWDMAALLLHQRYHLIALDQRGHGDTDWTAEAELGRDNGELMLEDTRQFIEHLGYARVSLVGMSMGGMNAIRYAAEHSERLDVLGIVDVAPETMKAGHVEMEAFRSATETLAQFDDFLSRAVHFMPHRPVAHLRYSLTHSLKRTADGYTWKQDHRPRPAPPAGRDLAADAERRRETLWDAVRAIRVPTLLFRGTESKILSQDVAERMVKTMHDAELVLIERATHNVHSDNPRDFARALDSFLSRRLPAASAS